MNMKTSPLLLVVITCLGPALAAQPRVTTMRVPEGGVQPQVAVDAKHVVHLIYLAGDPAHCDVFYTRSSDDGGHWSKPVRVNSHEGSGIALGTVRGAQLALGRGGRVHVVWMGSDKSEPKAPGKATPMLYTRSTDDGAAFEAERNVVTSKVGLDGGGSVAADDAGHVFVAWHAPGEKGGSEADRRVWVARSTDDGQTFVAEAPLSDASIGGCGCCGMKVFASGGKLYGLYRGAAEQVNRGMYLLTSGDDLRDANAIEISPMRSGVCVMSTSALARGAHGVLAAWETKDRIYWARIDPAHPGKLAEHRVPGGQANRKHPAIASNDNGDVLTAWAEGTGWNKGGSVGWQVYGAGGNLVAAGRADALPAWDEPAAFATRDGHFVVLY